MSKEHIRDRTEVRDAMVQYRREEAHSARKSLTCISPKHEHITNLIEAQSVIESINRIMREGCLAEETAHLLAHAPGKAGGKALKAKGK